MTRFIILLTFMLVYTKDVVCQATVDLTNCTKVEIETPPGPPAPCSIETQLTVPSYTIYAIRVGKYEHLISSYPNVFAIQIGSYFYYYYYILYADPLLAKNDLKILQDNGYFCDGYVTEFPIKTIISFIDKTKSQ